MWTCDRCMVAVRGAQISSIQVDSPSLPAGWVYGEYCWDTGHQGQETLCEECSQQELEDYNLVEVVHELKHVVCVKG